MKTQGILGFENVEQNTLQGSMFKGFPNQKSKMSQGEEGEGSEVHLGPSMPKAKNSTS